MGNRRTGHDRMATSETTPDDRKRMARCLKLARRGLGKVEPNPVVGALVVRSGRTVARGWHARFGRAPDPRETGFGHDPLEQAAAFRSPNGATLLDYHRAALNRLRQYASGRLTEAELELPAPSPTLGTDWTVRRRLVGIVDDGLQHLGQAAYVRGLLKGAGWLGR